MRAAIADETGVARRNQQRGGRGGHAGAAAGKPESSDEGIRVAPRETAPHSLGSRLGLQGTEPPNPTDRKRNTRPKRQTGSTTGRDVRVPPAGDYNPWPLASTAADEMQAGRQGVTSAVRAAGGRIFLQLWHKGRASHSDFHDRLELPRTRPTGDRRQATAFPKRVDGDRGAS